MRENSPIHLNGLDRPEEKCEPGTRQDFGMKIAEINVWVTSPVSMVSS